MAAEQQAAKACQRADELFRAGNVCGAHRLAGKAKRLCPSLPGVANALSAYEVLLAAAAAGTSANNKWRAVLGIRPDAATTDAAVKKQFRRLSLLVHPDKNRCAAAEEAFKLLRQAYDAALAARPEDRGPCAAAAAHDEAPRRPAARDEPRRSRADEQSSSRDPTFRRRGAGIDIDCPSCRFEWPVLMERGVKCARCHVRLRNKADEHPWSWGPTRRWGNARIDIYCPSCGNEWPMLLEQGIKCAKCHVRLRYGGQSNPPGTGKKQPPGAFPCQWRCPRCEAQRTSDVTVGVWFLVCNACSKRARVHVKGPNLATATAA
jgi:ferredoxin